ncbi:MAG: MotA/TolQ/ExbB proton channel family protein [Akkermansia sp.]|nr:MotA/TolQ/ExbB proton channel family protein [Akkermansia sp.]
MKSQYKQIRINVMCNAIMLALLIIILCNALPLPPKLACFLVDKHETTGAINIFAAQNAMWVAFLCGLGEIYVRWNILKNDKKELHMHLLPENPQKLLDSKDMAKIHRNVVNNNACGHLGIIIRMMASQFQSSKSLEMTTAVLNTETEARNTEIDLGYNMIRYIAWLLPTLGFIGTVWGILKALEAASAGDISSGDLLPNVISSMSVAFWTTLLALLMSCVLMCLMHYVQGEEESNLNKCSHYCLEHFINRLLDVSHTQQKYPHSQR